MPVEDLLFVLATIMTYALGATLVSHSPLVAGLQKLLYLFLGLVTLATLGRRLGFL